MAPVANGKTKEESSDDDSSDDEVPAQKVEAKPAAKKEDSSSDEDSSDDEEEKKPVAKAAPAKKEESFSDDSSDSDDEEEKTSAPAPVGKAAPAKKEESSSDNSSDSDDEEEKMPAPALIANADPEKEEESSSDNSSDSDDDLDLDFGASDDPDDKQPTPIKFGKLECPFKNDDPVNVCQLTEKQKSDNQDFRNHLFLHFRESSKDWITSHWDERMKNLEKGDQLSMYCDLCLVKKRIKSVTKKGLRNAMICHLALFHNELRDIMEKYEKFSKDFIKSVFYDVDMKKIWKIVVNEATKLGKTNEIEPLVKDNGPDEIPDFSSGEPDLWEPQHKINKKSTAPPASKKTSVIKSKAKSRKVSPDPVLRPNIEVVRKRRPINFTLGTINILRNYL